MDRKRIMLIRDSITCNIPAQPLIRELTEYLTGSHKGYDGLNEQSVLIYLLDYYIEREFPDTGQYGEDPFKDIIIKHEKEE